MRKAGSLSQEQSQQPLDASEQPVQTTNELITNVAPVLAATISCALCDARFALAPGCEDDGQSDATEIEAAFMGICHFCFRCRRAACPECWDPVHHVCAQCVTWAGLPFRAEPLPLANLIIPPLSSERQAQAETIAPFVCVRHGRYQSAEIAASDPETDFARQLVDASLSQKTPSERASTEDEYDVQSSQPALLAIAAPVKKTIQMKKLAEDGQERKPRRSAFKIIERTLTIIALAVLLTMIVLIVLAEMSTRANSEIMRLLRVDIRSEVAYLIVLIKQIHW